MNKSVLLSTQPQWCEAIASGRKTVEIRKSKPNQSPPFQVYIYCTKGNPILGRCLVDNSLKETAGINFDNYNRDTLFRANGKVVGEFVCDKIFPIRVFENGGIQDYMFHKMEQSLVPYDDIAEYIGKGNTGYGWHISDLLVYDRPRDLSDFHTEPCLEFGSCSSQCKHYECNTNANGVFWDCGLALQRPPRSWCYVYKFF